MRLSSHVWDELQAAGLDGHSLGISYSLAMEHDQDRQEYVLDLERTSLSLAQIGLIMAVLDAHDPDTPPRVRILSPREFRQLFTDAELDAILDSSDTFVRRLIAKLYTSDAIELDDPEVQAGVNHLVTLGLLTAERGSEVLS